MTINVNQINQAQLAAYVIGLASGNISGGMAAYVAASGYLGGYVMYLTGDQTITGQKTFNLNPIVPYYGGTGAAPSALYVTDQVASLSGALNAQYATIPFVTGISGALAAAGGINLSYSGYVENAFVHRAGNEAITGTKTFVTAPLVPIHSTTGAAVNLFYVTGISGALQTLISAGGGGGSAPNAVYTTGDQTMSGLKSFTGGVTVGPATLTGHAINLGFFSGVTGSLVALNLSTSGALTGLNQATSGILNSQMIAASGILSARDLSISGALQAQIIGGGGTISNFAITGTGTINITLNASGNMTNTISVSGNATNYFNTTGIVNNTFNGSTINTFNVGTVTGNFVNISFYFEPYNLNTGLAQVESFIARTFTFTGYALGAQTSGTQGFLSGSFYQRTTLGNKIPFCDFSYNSGQFFTGLGGFVQVISGMNRVGIDITRLGTGMTGLTVGLFGVGY